MAPLLMRSTVKEHYQKILAQNVQPLPSKGTTTISTIHYTKGITTLKGSLQ